jgi:hypothetical protein
MSEEEFYARLEYLYHALQVTSLEPEASERWEKLMAQAMPGAGMAMAFSLPLNLPALSSQ